MAIPNTNLLIGHFGTSANIFSIIGAELVSITLISNSFNDIIVVVMSKVPINNTRNDMHSFYTVSISSEFIETLILHSAMFWNINLKDSEACGL